MRNIVDEFLGPAPNTLFRYLYRDADNYKKWGEVVFSGRPTEDLVNTFFSALSDGKYFIAHQVGLPEVFLWDPEADYDPENPPVNLWPGSYIINDADHCWHEADSFEDTHVPPTDSRSIQTFIFDVFRASLAGWQVFRPGEPHDTN